jgi:hypothetical protein
MPELDRPSRQLADRLLSKLGYEGRLLASEISPYSGCNDLWLFSLKEAAEFLDADPRVLNDMTGFMRFIEPDDLRKWAGEVLGDAELAGSIGDLMKGSEACQDSLEKYRKKIEAIQPIKELLLARLKQCDEVLGEETKIKEVY